MKKALLLLIAGLLVTGVAGASSLGINCGGATIFADSSGNASIPSTNINCPQFTVPSGQTLFDIILFFQNDYSLGNNTTTNSWTFNWINIQPGFVAGNTYSDTVSGTASSNTFNPSGSSFYQVGEISSGFANFLGAGTVQVASLSTSHNLGLLVPVNGHLDSNVFIQFDYGTAGVPEPVTLSLVGGGLLAVGLLARKRRKV